MQSEFLSDCHFFMAYNYETCSKELLVAFHIAALLIALKWEHTQPKAKCCSALDNGCYYGESLVCNSFQHLPPGPEHKLKSSYTDLSACRKKMKVGEGKIHPSWDSSTSQGIAGAGNLKVGLPYHDEETQKTT